MVSQCTKFEVSRFIRYDAMKGRLKMRDMKMRDQFAKVENAGKVSMASQSVKKRLKVVVFVCRVIPSV